MPRIVLKNLESDKTQTVPLPEAMIGRDPTCAFVIEGPNSRVVSGRHARIFYQDGTWWIEDSSRNGTILDDERLQAGQRHSIKEGQQIGLGESGPRLRVILLEARQAAETIVEAPEVAPPAQSRVEPSAPPPSPAPAAARSRPTTKARPAPIEESTEPISPSPDWLVHVVLRAQNTNQRHDVRAMVVRIGRSPDCNVQVPAEQGASVSRIHAEIVIQDGGVMIRDSGSRNGTFVNGKRLESPQTAAKSDQIMLGSGGPIYAIEDLHIVKGPDSTPPDGGGATDITPPEVKDQGGPLRGEPRTDPAPKSSKPFAVVAPVSRARRSLADAAAPLLKDVLEDVPEKERRNFRYFVWAGVVSTVVIAALLLALTQRRVTASEQRMDAERRAEAARADSIRAVANAEVGRLRAKFDSARTAGASRAVIDSLRDQLADAARRTGVPEQALARARQSLEQQLASGDSARRNAENEVTRLREHVSNAQAAGNVPRTSLDSLRRELRDAEVKALEVASHLGAVRGADLAQVVQLNQNAVGLVRMFSDSGGSEGSGFAITPSGYFVTNRHVVTTDSGKLADSVLITMADQRFLNGMRADVVALGQGDIDIAVLKIRGYRGPYIKKVNWNATSAKTGEPAALIGFAPGTTIALDTSDFVRTSVNAGILSRVAPGRIHFDGFAQNGSSGSPVFNSSGEVVAVHSAVADSGAGLGYAVPVAHLLLLLPNDAKSELGLR